MFDLVEWGQMILRFRQRSLCYTDLYVARNGFNMTYLYKTAPSQKWQFDCTDISLLHGNVAFHQMTVVCVSCAGSLFFD